MACRSCCRRQLSLFGRQANILAEAQIGAAPAITTPPTQQTARQLRSRSVPKRSFHNTPRHAGKLTEAAYNLFAKQAEPYKVVHATEAIYKACAREALYKIDPAHMRAGTIPKTPEGEDIGVSAGPWHNGMMASLPKRICSYIYIPLIPIADLNL